MNDAIYLFRGKHAFLSNYYPAKVIDHCIEYPSAEHAFQAAKTWDVEVRLAISKLPVGTNPKAAGIKINVRDDWKTCSIDELTRITWDKFFRNPDLAIKLLATGDRPIFEGTTWNDRFWGIDLKTKVGENHFGIILEKTRTKLQGYWNSL